MVIVRSLKVSLSIQFSPVLTFALTHRCRKGCQLAHPAEQKYKPVI